MSNIITIALCEEDRKRIDELIAFAGLLVGELKSRGVPVCHELEAVVAQEAPEEEAPRPLNLDVIMPARPASNEPPEIVDESSEPAAEPEQPEYTKDDVLAKVQSLAGPNNPKREEAKAIVKSYGAKVSDIPADKYAEVMEKLTELAG